jgi:hypothetical protein
MVLGGVALDRSSSGRQHGVGDNFQLTHEEVPVGDVVYTSKVRVVRHRGPVREAFLPARKEAVTFGVHSEVAEHYGVDPGDSPPDATTLDYVVAAACG